MLYFRFVGYFLVSLCFHEVVLAQSVFTDSDWNVSFRESCDFPAPINGVAPVSWITQNGDGKLEFSLQIGQVGTCANDEIQRHGAPFWERAEVSQVGQMELGKVHTAQFEATFLEGFTAERETFFQIHNWAKDCDSYPPVMMKIDNRKLQIFALRGVRSDEIGVTRQGSHRRIYSGNINYDALYGRPINFQVSLDTREEGKGLLSVRLNDQVLVKNKSVEYANCSDLYVKFGVYRPGGNNVTSKVLFDDLNVLSQ